MSLDVSVSSSPVQVSASATSTRIRSWITDHKLLTSAFVLLFVLALAVRVLSVDRLSPYQDYSDELVHFHLAQHARGLSTATYLPDKYAPPTFYGYFNAGVQILTETLNPRPWYMLADYIMPLRYASLIAGMLTIAVIASIGWQMAGPLAGWLAALVWAIAPTIVESNNLAIPDAFVYLGTALIFATTFRAWRTESPRWLLLSLLSGLLVIYSKFWVVTGVVPFLIVGTLLTLRQPRTFLPWMVLCAVISALALWYLLVVVNPLAISQDAREVDTFRTSGIGLALNPDRNFNNFWFAIYPIGYVLFYAGLAGGIIGYSYNVRHGQRVIRLRDIALIAAFVVPTLMMSATFTYVWLGAGKIRHSLPVTIAILPLWGAAIAQTVWALRAWMRQRNRDQSRITLASAGVIGLVLVAFVPTALTEDANLIQRFRRTSIQEVLWNWSDVNLSPDGFILANPDSTVAHTWNRPWSGYNGVKTFEWWLEEPEQIAASTPERYVERGIRYFVLDARDLELYYNTPQMADFIDQLTLVKTIPATPDRAGDTAYFYRMLPPSNVVDVDFGGQVRLVGYDLSGDTPQPGDTLTFRPYWQVDARPTSNYSMFIHLYPADEQQLIAQYDGAPTVSDRPTLTWDDTTELYIGTDAIISIPADTPSSEYRLAIGLYDFNSGARLTLPDGETFYSIPITVE